MKLCDGDTVLAAWGSVPRSEESGMAWVLVTNLGSLRLEALRAIELTPEMVTLLGASDSINESMVRLVEAQARRA